MKFLLILLSLILSISCSKFGDDKADNSVTTPDTEQPEEGNGGNDDNSNSGNDNGGGSQTPPTEWGDERSYVFDLTHVPEVHMTISLDEWNRLLSEYDKDSNTKEYFHCDVKINLKGEEYSVIDAGVRLKGNTSRRRPENGNGKHVKDKADWQHCHFQFNFRKYNKDEQHTIRGVRKMYLKWFKDDAAYCREIYCYDLFRRFEIGRAHV